MSLGINKVIIIGNAGGDPRVRDFGDGGKLASFSLAVGERWKDRNGQKQERTEWFRCVARGKLAEMVERWVTKGTRVYVEGPLKTREYESDSGPREISEIMIQQLNLLGGQQNQSDAPAQEKPRTRQQQPQEEFDDDIPF